MNEKEKMMKGKLYDPSDAQLKTELMEAKVLCHKLNQLSPDNESGRARILQELLPSYDSTCHIESPFYCDYGRNIHLQKHVYANHNLIILDAGGVYIGNHVFIGPNVCLTTAGHPESVEIRNRELEYAYPITIQDNVWIGANVVVNPGVCIKEGSIIGSGSVVTHDIPAHVVAAGVPCTVIRSIQDRENDNEKNK